MQMELQAGSQTLLKKRIHYGCFPVNFAKLLRADFYRTRPGDFSVFYCTRTECKDQDFQSTLYTLEFE